MDPYATERARDSVQLLKTILEEVRIVKEYVLEIKKSQSQRIKQIEDKNL
jgi:hypothetical protein